MRPAVLAERRPVEVAERREPTRMRPVVTVQVVFELVAPPTVQVHDRVHVARGHIGKQRIHVTGGPASIGSEPPTAQRKVAQRRVERRGLQAG